MKLKIIASGGMSIVPSSFCKCKICEEARKKGARYERLGPSLYIDDIKMLIDTPEDIAVACNRQKISEVKNLSITHNDLYYDADILIISLVSDDGILNDGTELKDAPFKDEIFTLDEVIEIKNYYRIKRIIVSHIDEMWGKSYGYYYELEKELDNISFAYDGMEIIV